jgi:hypothetical protein
MAQRSTRSILLEVLYLDCLPDVIGFPLVLEDDLSMNLPGSAERRCIEPRTLE